MQGKAAEAAPMQGKAAAGAPLRGISLEDRAAQAKELAAFWTRQSQLLHDKLQKDGIKSAAVHGVTATEKQGEEQIEAKFPSEKQEPKPDDPASETQAQRPGNEGEEIAGEAQPRQGTASPDEASVCSVKPEQTQEQGRCKEEEHIEQ